MITIKETSNSIFQNDSVNSLRYNASVLFLVTNRDQHSTIINDALQALQALNGVSHWKSTSFQCKYHFNREKEQNLLEFCSYISMLEQAEINGHWIWVEKANNPSKLKDLGFRRCNSGDRIGQYYIKAYGQNWNTGKTKFEVIRQLHQTA